MKKIAFLAAAVALMAVVVPAQAAKPDNHKCVPHPVAYDVSGTLASTGSLTANSDGTYSGTLSVLVKRTNKHGKADKGTTKSYTLDHAKVTFGHGVDKSAPAAGSRVNLKGTITTLAKKCPGPFTPTITIKKAEIHTAHA